MELIGRPFVIQNTTDRSWLVTKEDAVTVTSADGRLIESVSFTVAVPRNTGLTIGEAETFAMKRAVELLQEAIRMRSEG